MNKLISLAFIIGIVFQNTHGQEVRHLKPPILDQSHIGKKIICYRPVRVSGPKLLMEIGPSRIIIHNYGHGGAGWSLSYGSAIYSVKNLLKTLPDMDRSQPVAIVGAGCIGLLTAYCLLENGFTNITIYAESFSDLASDRAGGLLSFRATYSDPKFNTFIKKIAVDTYNFYKTIALQENKDFIGGAKLISTYFETIESSELEAFVGRVMSPAKKVIIDFGNGVSHKMVAYDDSIFIDTGKMMELLKENLYKKVKMHKRKISSFNEINHKIVFNCTGLGSKALQKDDSLKAVIGHLVMLKNQSAKDMDYMLIIDYPLHSKTASGVIRTLDFFPKRLPVSDTNDIGVLGGTFFDSVDDIQSHDQEFDNIIKRAKQFFYGATHDAKILMHKEREREQ